MIVLKSISVVCGNGSCGVFPTVAVVIEKDGVEIREAGCNARGTQAAIVSAITKATGKILTAVAVNHNGGYRQLDQPQKTYVRISARDRTVRGKGRALDDNLSFAEALVDALNQLDLPAASSRRRRILA